MTTKFQPEFDHALEGWVHNYLKTNYWRVERTLSYDDVMQEAHIVYLGLVQRYTAVDNQGWFMALFKRSWTGHFYDLAMRASRIRVNEVSSTPQYVDEDESESYLDLAVGDRDNLGAFEVLVNQAPREVKEVLNLMFGTPAEVLEMAAAAWKASGRKKPFGNAMLCHLLGKDPDTVDLEGAVREHFTQTENPQ